MGLVPGGRVDKTEVRYRPHERCVFCDHYFASGTCDIVNGTIAADAVCDKFEIKSATNIGKDSGFYMNEYVKAEKKAKG